MRQRVINALTYPVLPFKMFKQIRVKETPSNMREKQVWSRIGNVQCVCLFMCVCVRVRVRVFFIPQCSSENESFSSLLLFHSIAM